MTDGARETRIVPVAGRMIVVRQLRDAQLALFGREASILREEDATEDRRLKAVSRMLDLLESMVVQEVDRDFLMDLNLKGDLELSTLMGFIAAFSEEQKADPQKATVRRGRRPASQ